MIWLIAKKELYDNWRSHKIPLAFALCAILLAMSVWLGLKDYSARTADYSATRKVDTFFRDRIYCYVIVDEQGKVDLEATPLPSYRIVEILGVYRRPTELSVLVRGLEHRMNRFIRFFNMSKFGLQSEIETGNPPERNRLFALFSPPDFLFITKVILSLLTILFAFDTIAVSGNGEPSS